LRRAAVLASRFDLAALYLGLASSVLGPDRNSDPDTAGQLSGPV
jgi:hypothetical protein